MTTLTFKTITDENEARELWNAFSPHHVIDDEWDFRYTFVKELELPFRFIVGYANKKPIGLLPLQQNTLKGIDPKLFEVTKPFLEFFGGADTANNGIFLLPGYEQYNREFLEQITLPAILAPLAEKYTVDDQKAIHHLDIFTLNLENITSFETLLQNNFNGKSRQRLINRINHLRKTYEIEIKEGEMKDLELLFHFSKKRFGERSSFHMEYRQQVFKNLFQLFDHDLFTITVNGEPNAISFSLIYKGAYITRNIGYDLSIRDLGKLVITSQIQRAIEKQCTVYDAGKGDNGWKEHFHLTKIPQYKLTLNNPN